MEFQICACWSGCDPDAPPGKVGDNDQGEVLVHWASCLSTNEEGEMKVKVGDQIFSSDDQPIMVVFEDSDKKNVQNMEENAHKYASAPDNYFVDDDKFLSWMREGI